MGDWLKWISGETGDSTSKTAEAGHDFRDDSGAREAEDDFSTCPSWAPTETESGIPMIPEGTTIEEPQSEDDGDSTK